MIQDMKKHKFRITKIQKWGKRTEGRIRNKKKLTSNIKTELEWKQVNNAIGNTLRETEAEMEKKSLNKIEMKEQIKGFERVTDIEDRQ